MKFVRWGPFVHALAWAVMYGVAMLWQGGFACVIGQVKTGHGGTG